jgi:hypothetical protein
VPDPVGSTGAALSVIVATPRGSAPVRQLMRYLAAQTAKDRLEIVFVVPTAEGFDLGPFDLSGFHQSRILEVGAFPSINRARVAGIRAARAPLVVLTEDHSFPAPDWAEALIRAHAGPWAAVGPAVGLANRHGWRSWSNYLIQYGPWTLPSSSRVVDDLPGHNSSYKREILLEYGDALEEMMEFEFLLHRDLQRRGYACYLAADAVTYHLFMTRLRPWFLEHLSIGQMLAACRTRDLSALKRLLLLLRTPLVPAVRLIRILRKIRRQGWQRELIPGVLPWLTAGLLVSALGEWLGTAFGEGRAAAWTLDIDFERDRFVSDAERRRIWSEPPVDFGPLPVEPRIGSRAGPGGE